MQLKLIVSALALSILTSGCALLQKPPREVEIITKPIKIDIVQPVMPRAIDLKEPKWYVVSDTKIINRCLKVMKIDENGNHIINEDGTHQTTRPKTCELSEREFPEWPVDYTYLDRFIDDIKKKHGGDIVFFAMTADDYELMAYNTQEITRYINQLGEVIVYYRNVTINDEDAAAVEIKVENENGND